MPRLDRRLVIAVQVVFAAAVLLYGGRTIAREWDAVRAEASALRLNWWLIALASAIVLATYGLLIETWRRVVAAWGSRLSWGGAARIWFVSNLGRYLPGKVWGIGTMAVMAQRSGASPVAATGSAVLINLVSVIAGFAIVVAMGAGALLGRGSLTAIVVLTVALLALPRLLPVVARLASRVTGRTITLPALPARALWIAVAGSAIAWLCYGAAFRLLAVAVVPGATGALSTYTAAYTASYLVGFLALFAPGGLVVREEMLWWALPALGAMTRPEAVLVAVVSRLWLTVLEIVPGALFLARDAMRHSHPDRSPDVSS